MKLIMEGWRNFLTERELGDSLHGQASANTKYAKKGKSPGEAFLNFLIDGVHRMHSSPADLKGVIKMLVRGYNKNEAIKKAEASLSPNKLKKIDTAVTALKDIAKSKDNKEVNWKFSDACRSGVFGGSTCTLGSVISRYDRLENTSMVLGFSMMKQSEKTLQKIRFMATEELKPFIRITANRKDAAKVYRNFKNFVEVLLSISYSSTYIHELYHYYEFSKEFKHDTEEWQMMKNLGYRNPDQEHEYPKKFIGARARTTGATAELRAIQVQEDYLKVLSSSLPIHIKKTEKTPGYVGSWAENPKDRAMLAALDNVFKATFAAARAIVAAYREKQHRSLYALFNNLHAWETIGKGIKKPKSGPYLPQKDRWGYNAAHPRFTSTGHIRGPDGKAITGPSAKLPRIKRRGDSRSDSRE